MTGLGRDENIVAWEVKGKILCGNCVPKGAKINKVLTEVDIDPSQEVVCQRCGAILYEEEIDPFAPQ
jgi:hypothetical protein